jgi:hypothetical protein
MAADGLGYGPSVLAPTSWLRRDDVVDVDRLDRDH